MGVKRECRERKKEIGFNPLIPSKIRRQPLQDVDSNTEGIATTNAPPY